jgi:hypothetical protein
VKRDIVFEAYYDKIDISVVREFEKKIGFKFPQAYVDIIIDFNGATITNHIETFYFYSNFIDRYESYPLGRFLGYNTHCSIEWYWQSNLSRDEELAYPKNVIAFAVDPGGEEICFDYRHDPKTDNPKIVVWHHEAESGSSSELSFVATSFDEFLDMLYDSSSAVGKIYNEELFWQNRENRRKEALENQ